MSTNINEYVVNRIIEYAQQQDDSIEKRDKHIKRLKDRLKREEIYECDWCNHFARQMYVTICYRCCITCCDDCDKLEEVMHRCEKCYAHVCNECCDFVSQVFTYCHGCY